MNYNTYAHYSGLDHFRRGLYACFHRAGDALMNTNDALLCDVTARSFIELSLSPFFVRGWPSLYEGLQDAVIDRPQLQKLFARHVAAPAPGQRLVLGVDASSIARPLSPTARDRTYVHAALMSMPHLCPCRQSPQRQQASDTWLAVFYYLHSTLCVLPETPSSWTYILDNQRVPSQDTQAKVAAAQLASLLPLLTATCTAACTATCTAACTAAFAGRPLLLADGYYGSATFLEQTKEVACDKLLRLAKNRTLYRPAPPRTGKKGAPKKDGPRFACGQPETHGPTDQQWSGQEESGKPLTVSCWQNLHFQAERDQTVTVLRITRPHTTQAKMKAPRDQAVRWFVFCGQSLPPLSEIPALYRRRYSLEHGYRVDKQNLLWATPRLRTPESFDHWTTLVASVRNQLCLARPLVQASRHPWESKHRAVTPEQVRRGCGPIIAQLGSLARLPQVRGKSPGRPRGAVIKKATRYLVIHKATKKANKNAEVV